MQNPSKADTTVHATVNPIAALAWAPSLFDSGRLAFTSGKNLFIGKIGETPDILHTFGANVQALTWNSASDTLYTGSDSGVDVLDVPTGKLKHQIHSAENGDSRIVSCKWSGDHNILVTAHANAGGSAVEFSDGRVDGLVFSIKLQTPPVDMDVRGSTIACALLPNVFCTFDMLMPKSEGYMTGFQRPPTARNFNKIAFVSNDTLAIGATNGKIWISPSVRYMSSYGVGGRNRDGVEPFLFTPSPHEKPGQADASTSTSTSNANVQSSISSLASTGGNVTMASGNTDGRFYFWDVASRGAIYRSGDGTRGNHLPVCFKADGATAVPAPCEISACGFSITKTHFAYAASSCDGSALFMHTIRDDVKLTLV